MTEQLTATAGLRYYDFKEVRSFTSGGLFSNGDNQTDTTKSDGFSPRVLLSYEANDNITINAQASKGFRLGGANDPLNLGLCGPSDAATFGGFPTYDDETLVELRSGREDPVPQRDLQRRRLSIPTSRICRSPPMPEAARRASCSTPMRIRWASSSSCPREPLEGLDLSLAGSWVEAEFDEHPADGQRRDPRRHQRGQPASLGSEPAAGGERFL